MLNIPARFKSLDFMKGTALIMILEAHLGLWWTDHSWFSAWTLTTMIIRPFGPSNFILISIFGTILSLDIREKAMPGKSELPRLLKRTFIFLIIGTILNIIDLSGEIANPAVFFGYKIARIMLTWNIFTFLGVAQVIIFFFRRLNAKIQIAFTVGVFIFYYIMIPSFVQSFVALGIDYQNGTPDLTHGMTPILFIYFTLFFENAMATFVPYIAAAFLTCIIYKRLADICSDKTAEKSKLMAEFRSIKWISVGLILAGILIGFPFSPGLMMQLEYQHLISPFIIQVGSSSSTFQLWNPSWGGYPLFLQQNNPAFILYSFGLMSIVSVCMMERVDIPGKNPKIVDVISRFGVYSLSVFTTHAVASYLPLPLGYLQFLLAFAAVAIGYIIVFYVWDVKWNGKYTFEYWLKLFLATNISLTIKRKMAVKKAHVS